MENQQRYYSNNFTIGIFLIPNAENVSFPVASHIKTANTIFVLAQNFPFSFLYSSIFLGNTAKHYVQLYENLLLEMTILTAL